MKKTISLLVSLVLMLAAIQVKAQTPQIQAIRAGDTLVNTDTLTREFTFTAGYSGIIITPVAVKISGTVAGTAYLYESPNGVDYNTTPSDSLVLANSAGRQFKGMKITAPVAYKYKIVFISSGTQSYYTRFYILTRKYSDDSGGPSSWIKPLETDQAGALFRPMPGDPADDVDNAFYAIVREDMSTPLASYRDLYPMAPEPRQAVYIDKRPVKRE